MATESVPTQPLRRSELIACDHCGKPLEYGSRQHSTTSEREFGFASFAYVLCGECDDVRAELVPEERRDLILGAILTRAGRHSSEWRLAVASQIGSAR